jgi:hypothetical protein
MKQGAFIPLFRGFILSALYKSKRVKRIGAYVLTSALLTNVYFLPAQAQNSQ